MTRQQIHQRFCDAAADWMYNSHAVAPGADESDAPVTVADVRRICDEALANGCDRGTVARWRETAMAIVA